MLYVMLKGYRGVIYFFRYFVSDVCKSFIIGFISLGEALYLMCPITLCNCGLLHTF